MGKLYTLKVTKEELWVLSEGYAASFTAPDERNAVEISVSDKLRDLYQKCARVNTRAGAELGRRFNQPSATATDASRTVGSSPATGATSQHTPTEGK